MARVKFNSKTAASNVLKKFNKVKSDERLNKEIGQFVVKRIRAEARRRKPLNNKRRFKDLSQLTIENRKRLEKFNRTDRNYSAEKSNLTFTGQLLDAITYRYLNNFLVIEVEDNKRKPYRTGPNSREKKVRTNREVQQFLLEISKDFAIFTTKGIKSENKIIKRIRSIVLRFLRRELKRSR